MNTSLHLKERLREMGTLEKSFAAAPEQYWPYAALLITLFLVAGLLFAGLVFWQFAISKSVPENLDAFVNVAALDQAKFDATLTSINNEKAIFDADVIALPAHDPFAGVR